MKKIFSLTFIMAALFILNACTSNALVIYMPKEYISEDLIDAFEQETGIQVALRYFDSNEVLLTNAKVNSYDLIIPSDYAIEELAAGDYLKPLDWDRIDFDKADFSVNLSNAIDQLNTGGFDILEYSLPYFWGTVGLIYNNTKTGLYEDLVEEEWNILNNPNYSKMIYDSSRDAFMAALYANNFEMNNATSTEVNVAKNWLIDAYSKSNASIKSDEILSEAIDNNTPYDVAMVYSGDAVYILQENEKYSYFVPTWTNVWIDGYVIPTNTKHEDWAYEFINFMSTYDALLDNATEMGYSPISEAVYQNLYQDEEFNWDNDRIGYAFSVPYTNFEFFRYDVELKKLMDDAWELVILSN